MNCPSKYDEVCAVITTYRPNDGFYQRILCAIDQVGFIIIVDDGDCSQNVLKLRKWFKNNLKIHLHHNVSNVGIANSLNKGVYIAKDRGYRWILTLDDDSLIKPGMVKKLINGLENIKLNKPIGIIGMSWAETSRKKEEKPNREKVSYSEKRGIITSGSFFSTETYDIIGQFREEFYIDSVDYEYCLRARRKGFAVVKLDEIGFSHSLGQSKVVKVLGLEILIENHEASRVYYGSRNSSVLALEYLREDPLYSFAVLFRQIKILCIVLLFEVSKINKIRNMIIGVKDGLRYNLGKRNDIK